MRNVCPHCKAKFRLGGRPTAVGAAAGKSWQVLSSVFRCPHCGRAMRQAAGAQLAAVLATLAFVLWVGGWLFKDQLVGTVIDAALFERIYDSARVVLFVALFVYAWRGATYVAHDLQSDRRIADRVRR